MPDECSAAIALEPRRATSRAFLGGSRERLKEFPRRPEPLPQIRDVSRPAPIHCLRRVGRPGRDQKVVGYVGHRRDEYVASEATREDVVPLVDVAHATLQHVRIRRVQQTIFIWADYVEPVEFPGFVKNIAFSAHVERAF